MKNEALVTELSKVRVSCECCHLSSFCLADHMSEQEKEQLNKLIRHTHTVRRGDFLYRNGAEFTSLYAIRSGSFKVYNHTEEGNEQILGFYFPGDIIGFGTISSQRHSSSALALETSSYCTIPFARLEELSHEIPRLQHRIMQLMSMEISHDNELMSVLCNKNAEEKVGTFLATLSGHFSKLGYSSTNFKLPMSRQDIGNYLGLSVETVSRIFSRLQKDGIISINNKSVELMDPARLSEISQRCSGVKSSSSAVS